MEKEHTLPKRNIIIAVIALVLLGGLFAVWQINKDNVPPPQGSEETAGSTELLTADAKDIKYVKVKTGEEETTVKRENGKITISPAIEGLDDRVLEHYLSNYTAVYALKEVKDGYKRLSEYGIDEDDYYFEITLNDGAVHRFCIGNEIEGNYYCLRKKDKTVWLVPSLIGDTLMTHPKIKTESEEGLSIAIDYENLYYVGIKNNGTSVFEMRRIGNSTALPYNFYSSFEATVPYRDIVYGVKLENFLKSLGAVISPQGHMGLISEKGAECGIGKGYTLTVKDDEKTHTLTFGSRSASGVYMTYNDYPYVYLVNDTVLTALENIKPYEYITPYIDLYEVDAVSEIIIKSGETKHTLTINNANKKYSLNGKGISEDSFNGIYDKIMDISSYDGANVNNAKGRKICEFSFKLKNGKTYNRSYYDCGSDMVYMTTRESGIDATVKKTTIDNILRIIENLK